MYRDETGAGTGNSGWDGTFGPRGAETPSWAGASGWNKEQTTPAPDEAATASLLKKESGPATDIGETQTPADGGACGKKEEEQSASPVSTETKSQSAGGGDWPNKKDGQWAVPAPSGGKDYGTPSTCVKDTTKLDVSAQDGGSWAPAAPHDDLSKAGGWDLASQPKSPDANIGQWGAKPADEATTPAKPSSAWGSSIDLSKLGPQPPTGEKKEFPSNARGSRKRSNDSTSLKGWGTSKGDNDGEMTQWGWGRGRGWGGQDGLFGEGSQGRGPLGYGDYALGLFTTKRQRLDTFSHNVIPATSTPARGPGPTRSPSTDLGETQTPAESKYPDALGAKPADQAATPGKPSGAWDGILGAQGAETLGWAGASGWNKDQLTPAPDEADEAAATASVWEKKLDPSTETKSQPNRAAASGGKDWGTLANVDDSSGGRWGKKPEKNTWGQQKANPSGNDWAKKADSAGGGAKVGTDIDISTEKNASFSWKHAHNQGSLGKTNLMDQGLLVDTPTRYNEQERCNLGEKTNVAVMGQNGPLGDGNDMCISLEGLAGYDEVLPQEKQVLHSIHSTHECQNDKTNREKRKDLEDGNVEGDEDGLHVAGTYSLEMDVGEAEEDVNTCTDERTYFETKKKVFLNSQCTNLCVKCNLGGELLVCCSDFCTLAIHNSCLGSDAIFDSTGEFYCPFCAYSRTISSYTEIKKKAVMARKDLLTLICSGTEKGPKKRLHRLCKMNRNHSELDDGLPTSNELNTRDTKKVSNRQRKKKLEYEPVADPSECSPHKAPGHNEMSVRASTDSADAEDSSEKGSENSGVSKYFFRVRKQESSYPAIPQMRRQRLMWTSEEINKLKDGVRECSTPHNKIIPWKKILEYGAATFDRSRSAVDLKDKWRNMGKATSKYKSNPALDEAATGTPRGAGRDEIVGAGGANPSGNDGAKKADSAGGGDWEESTKTAQWLPKTKPFSSGLGADNAPKSDCKAYRSSILKSGHGSSRLRRSPIIPFKLMRQLLVTTGSKHKVKTIKMAKSCVQN